MSHFTTIETQIRDIEALRAVSRELGFDLLNHATARGYGGNEREKSPCLKNRMGVRFNA